MPRKTALFLFNYSKREMHGVFAAQEPGGINLEPEAFRSATKYGNPNASPYPAQIRFNTVSKFPPLPERCFQDIVDYECSSNRFHFELTPTQVEQMLNAFRAYADRGR